MTNLSSQQALLDKLMTLPPDKFTEVEDFIDFLLVRDKERHLVRASMKLSEISFNRVWDNPDDAEYDQL